MKGWRERAADIFTKQREIAANMKFAPRAGTTDFFENLPTKMGLSRVLSADFTHGIATNHRVEVPQNAERNCYKTPNG